MRIARSQLWWMVKCVACRWGNTRCGSEEDITRYGCPKCGGAITHARTTSDSRMGQT